MTALRLFIALLLLAVPAFAQTAATRATLYTEIDTLFADTGSDPITPAQLRTSLKNITASSYNGLTDGVVASTYQPLDSNLTAIAALTTTSHGRSFLAAANAAASATLAGVGTGDTPTFTGVITTGNAGFAAASPLQRVHIKTQNATLPGVVAGNMAHDYYGLLVESEDAILGLASRNEGGHGSGIDMMEVNAGVLADKWYFGRLTSGFNSSVYWAYGTVADYAALTDYMLLTTSGGMSLPQLGSTLSIGTSTVKGTLTLHGSGTETILLNTSDASDTHRLALGGGGSNSVTRGAYINLHGNEYSAQAGDVAILAGDSGVSGQGRIRFFTGTQSERAAFDKAGDLDFFTTTEATSGGDGSITTAGGIYATKKIITAGGFEGALTGNVTGNVSGSSGSTTGNAGTATALATTRTIGGSNFDGTANVTSFPSPGAIGASTPSTGQFTMVGLGAAAAANRPSYIAPSATASGGAAYLQWISGTATATANSDALASLYISSTFAKDTFTGLSAYGVYIPAASASGSGTIGNMFGIYIGTQTIGTTNYSIYSAGGNNVFVGGINSTPIGSTTADTGRFSTLTTTANIELGHASDTTLARVSAGLISVEGVAIPTISSADTLSNKTLASPTVTGTMTVGGASAATIDYPNAGDTNVTATGGGKIIYAPGVRFNGGVFDSAGADGAAGDVLMSDGSDIVWRGRQATAYAYTNSAVSTTFATTETFLGGANGYRSQVRLDLSNYTQARVVFTTGSTTPVASSLVSMQYYTSSSATIGDYLSMAASGEVEVSLPATANLCTAGAWTDLATGAKGDVFVVVICVAPSGSTSVTTQSVSLQFR